jgi:hypothetical protein
MNKADRDRLLELCAQIAVETDQTRFQQLVEELNTILSDKKDDAPKDGESGPESA